MADPTALPPTALPAEVPPLPSYPSPAQAGYQASPVAPNAVMPIAPIPIRPQPAAVEEETGAPQIAHDARFSRWESRLLVLEPPSTMSRPFQLCRVRGGLRDVEEEVSASVPSGVVRNPSRTGRHGEPPFQVPLRGVPLRPLRRAENAR